jgi:hypothetical protein
MLTASTDADGTRTYAAPRAFIDVALELFPGGTEVDAVFKLARAFSWHDAHSIERIAVHVSHAEAISFARERLQREQGH